MLVQPAAESRHFLVKEQIHLKKSVLKRTTVHHMTDKVQSAICGVAQSMPPLSLLSILPIADIRPEPSVPNPNSCVRLPLQERCLLARFLLGIVLVEWHRRTLSESQFDLTATE